MKEAVLHGPRDLRIEKLSLPVDDLKDHQIWVQTEVSALKIGTDRGNYEGAERVPGAPDYPRWVGDSNLGVVRGVGSEVTRFAPGDRVFSRQSHRSDYIAEEEDEVILIPDHVHPEDAVCLGLYHVSALSFWAGGFAPCENVAIVGLGLLGMAATALGRAFGARVVGLGNNLRRLEMAQKMGAHATFMSDDPDLQAKVQEFAGDEGIDLVVLTANPWPAYRTAAEIVRQGGRITFLSLPGRGEPSLDFNPLALKWFHAKGLTLRSVATNHPYLYPSYPGGGARFTLKKTAPALLQLMAEGILEPKRLITHRFPYHRMVEAYEMAFRREKSMLGVLFEWQ